MIDNAENTIYTAKRIILANGTEYTDTDSYFINGFMAIGNTWINTSYITRIIEKSVKK